MKSARRLIADVLQQKIADNYFRAAAAERLSEKILRANALQFFQT
jgi:hypothetical protein